MIAGRIRQDGRLWAAVLFFAEARRGRAHRRGPAVIAGRIRQDGRLWAAVLFFAEARRGRAHPTPATD